MRNVLGLVAFVVFICCVIGVAAGITWVVVKVSPTKKPKDEPPATASS
jgi:uncharacterized protein YneF (UPF0154 family)